MGGHDRDVGRSSWEVGQRGREVAGRLVGGQYIAGRILYVYIFRKPGSTLLMRST